jgi:hypothetical protein
MGAGPAGQAELADTTTAPNQSRAVTRRTLARGRQRYAKAPEAQRIMRPRQVPRGRGRARKPLPRAAPAADTVGLRSQDILDDAFPDMHDCSWALVPPTRRQAMCQVSRKASGDFRDAIQDHRGRAT